jgi:hypothetical protein
MHVTLTMKPKKQMTMKHIRHLSPLLLPAALAMSLGGQAQVQNDQLGRYRLHPNSTPRSFTIGTEYSNGAALMIRGDKMGTPTGDLLSTYAPEGTEGHFRTFRGFTLLGDLFTTARGEDIHLRATGRTGRLVLENARGDGILINANGYVGLGEFANSNGAVPEERLDLLTGKLRIRQLPSDPEMTGSSRTLVVDATTGLLGWRTFPTGGSSGCEWELVNGNTVTAIHPNGSNGDCPESDNKVGIGTFYPTSKLHVIYTPQGVGAYAGAQVHLQAQGASTDSNTGLSGGVVGSGDLVRGIYGYAFSDGRPARKLIGIEGAVYDISGTGEMSVGVYADARTANASHTAYGVRSYVTGGNALSRAGYFQGDLEYTGALISPSDRKLKNDINDLDGAMEILRRLEPKRFSFRAEEFKGMNLPTGTQMGLIAQEVEAVLPELVHEAQLVAVSDRDGKETSPAVKYKGVDYVSLIPLLIAGLNEQQATIERLQQQIDALSDGGALPEKVNDGTTGVRDPLTERLIISPNPFTARTTIRYFLSQEGSARLELTDAKGRFVAILEQLHSGKGEHLYEWNTSELPTGSYFLALVADGEVIVKRAVKVE